MVLELHWLNLAHLQLHTPQHLEPGTSSCTTSQIHDKEILSIQKIDLPKCLLVPPPLYTVATGSQELYYLLPYLFKYAAKVVLIVQTAKIGIGCLPAKITFFLDTTKKKICK